MAEAQIVNVIVEQHEDGFGAYPVGVDGIVLGEGDSIEEAIADLKSALAFHIETFGPEVLGREPAVIEVVVRNVALAG
jgi:predicted RNase H-like HicB family nuclease